MQQQHAPEVVVALYGGLPDAEAAMDELEDAGVPYPDIRMGAHTSGEPDLPALDAPALPERFWSLKVVIDQRGVYHAEDILRKHQPLAVGRLPAPNAGRSDTDLGAIAWRHYVFETPSATDWAGETAGATGNTGVINSGVFADGTLAEGNPPVRGRAGSHSRPASDRQRPTTDDRRSTTTSDSSRPDTELQE
jgi:hypothetical protein